MGKHSEKLINELGSKYYIENTDQLLSLIGIYLQERNQRESILWKQVFTYFWAILVVMCIPVVVSWGVTIPEMIENYIFPLIGLFLIIPFLFVAHGYICRLEACNNIYKDLIKTLPKEFQIKDLQNIKSNNLLAKKYISVFMIVLMTAILCFLGVFLLCYYSTP